MRALTKYRKQDKVSGYKVPVSKPRLQKYAWKFKEKSKSCKRLVVFVIPIYEVAGLDRPIIRLLCTPSEPMSHIHTFAVTLPFQHSTLTSSFIAGNAKHSQILIDSFGVFLGRSGPSSWSLPPLACRAFSLTVDISISLGGR
jgi:hypothetical protein